MTKKTNKEKVEFSSSENRICCRLLQKQAQALMQLLFNQHLPLTAHLYKQKLQLDAFSYLPLKVRLILEKEAVSWFLWLPLAFFSAVAEETALSVSAVDISPWPQVPVQCRVEMARKKVSLQQLQQSLKGEILPIELHSAMSFVLNNRTLFSGKVAEDANGLVFQITDIATKETLA